MGLSIPAEHARKVPGIRQCILHDDLYMKEAATETDMAAKPMIERV
jgi:hypothetical protein